MRVLVCGGRRFTDFKKLCRILDQVHQKRPITCLIHGDAPGADSLAGRWATLRGIPVVPYPADWEAHGRSHAGRMRNFTMLHVGRPDLVVAFEGGTGTTDMILQSKRAGIPVLCAWRF